MDVILWIILLIAIVFICIILCIILFIRMFEIPESEYKNISTYRKYYDNDEYDYGHNVNHKSDEL